MLSVYGGAKTKKDFKARAIGLPAVEMIQETSMFGPELRPDGSFAVVGPSPTVRKWYGTVVVESGIIKAVK